MQYIVRTVHAHKEIHSSWGNKYEVWTAYPVDIFYERRNGRNEVIRVERDGGNIDLPTDALYDLFGHEVEKHFLLLLQPSKST